MNPSLWNQSMLGPAATMPTTVDPDIANETIPMAVSTVNIITSIEGDQVVEPVTPDGVSIELANQPAGSTFSLFRNGLRLTEDVDFTRVDDAITLLFAPEAQDAFVAVYIPEP